MHLLSFDLKAQPLLRKKNLNFSLINFRKIKVKESKIHKEKNNIKGFSGREISHFFSFQKVYIF